MVSISFNTRKMSPTLKDESVGYEEITTGINIRRFISKHHGYNIYKKLTTILICTLIRLLKMLTCKISSISAVCLDLDGGVYIAKYSSISS